MSALNIFTAYSGNQEFSIAANTFKEAEESLDLTSLIFINSMKSLLGRFFIFLR